MKGKSIAKRSRRALFNTYSIIRNLKMHFARDQFWLTPAPGGFRSHLVVFGQVGRRGVRDDFALESGPESLFRRSLVRQTPLSSPQRGRPLFAPAEQRCCRLGHRLSLGTAVRSPRSASARFLPCRRNGAKGAKVVAPARSSEAITMTVTWRRFDG